MTGGLIVTLSPPVRQLVLHERETTMKRWMFFTYGLLGHGVFLGVFLYLAAFVGNLGVPHSIDSPPTSSFGTAIAIDLLLLGLFAVQHSVMARPAFKRVWTRVIPQPIERSTYVWASCAVTILLMWQWRPVDSIVWDVQLPALRWGLWCVFVAGWLLVPFVTLLISHFDLFGTRQVWLHLRGQEYAPPAFRIPLFYRHVRHPLYLGWTLAFWATPTMTLGHLVFAATLTFYMAAAAVLEERDLVAHFGRQYADYQRRVPMFVPQLRPLLPSSPDGDEACVRPQQPALTGSPSYRK